MDIKWNIGNLNKGKHLSISHREKISKTKKKQYLSGKLILPDNTGKTPWNIGRSWPEVVRKKISAAKKGSTPWNIGIAHSEQTRRKISQSRRGKTAWNQGLPRTEEEKRKISIGTKRMWVRRKRK